VVMVMVMVDTAATPSGMIASSSSKMIASPQGMACTWHKTEQIQCHYHQL
jgi:hypothetical protein